MDDPGRSSQFKHSNEIRSGYVIRLTAVKVDCGQKQRLKDEDEVKECFTIWPQIAEDFCLEGVCLTWTTFDIFTCPSF